ncbi:hypothetical protein XENORESO_008583 [Xenotaenia resolanae]|uniref:Uncharacterized protein n=1 Tax=Xenotaenia resolanae TaxID=208358 RepID=A0ABV0WXG3_9TELE
MAGKFWQHIQPMRPCMALLPGSNGLHVGSGGRTPAADGASPCLLTHHEGGVPHGTGLPPVPALEPKLTSAFRNMLARHDDSRCPSFPEIRSQQGSLNASTSVQLRLQQRPASFSSPTPS